MAPVVVAGTSTASSSLVKRWWDGLGFVAGAQGLIVARQAWQTERSTDLAGFALGLVLVFVLSTSVRSRNPVAWAARPYKVVARRGGGLDCPLGDQCVSHLGESAMGMLMGCYTVATASGGDLPPRLWVAPLIAAVARSACWCGVVGGLAAPHAVEEGCWAVAAATVALRARSCGHGEVCLFFAAWALCLVAVDVPMYVAAAKRHATDDKVDAFAVAKSLTQPLVDSTYDCWKDDIPWLTLYFVLGPWGALFLYQRVAAAA